MKVNQKKKAGLHAFLSKKQQDRGLDFRSL